MLNEFLELQHDKELLSKANEFASAATQMVVGMYHSLLNKFNAMDKDGKDQRIILNLKLNEGLNGHIEKTQ